MADTYSELNGHVTVYKNAGTSNIPPQRFVKKYLDGVDLCGNGELACGVSLKDDMIKPDPTNLFTTEGTYYATDDSLPVGLLVDGAHWQLFTDGVIAANAEVQSSTYGEAKTIGTGVALGKGLHAASNDCLIGVDCYTRDEKTT